MGAEIHSGVSNSAVHNHVDLIIHDNKTCINMLVRVTFMRFFFCDLYALLVHSLDDTGQTYSRGSTWHHRINTGKHGKNWAHFLGEICTKTWFPNSEVVKA